MIIGLGTIRPFGLSWERCHVPMDPKTLVTSHFHHHLHLVLSRVGEKARARESKLER